MNIVDKAILCGTGTQHPIRPRFSADISCEKTGDIRLNTLDRNTEYELQLILKQVFWANSAQLAGATEQAKKALTARLYGDIYRLIDPLISAAYGGDQEEVVRLAVQIKQELGL